VYKSGICGTKTSDTSEMKQSRAKVTTSVETRVRLSIDDKSGDIG